MNLLNYDLKKNKIYKINTTSKSWPMKLKLY